MSPILAETFSDSASLDITTMAIENFRCFADGTILTLLTVPNCAQCAAMAFSNSECDKSDRSKMITDYTFLFAHYDSSECLGYAFVREDSLCADGVSAG
ncbi:MAG: hypothetical protein JWN94_3882 [Betaproteobacteria bacterium]|nr:hypothetical protein [Betaproteobacteria bacterium]